MENKYRIAVFLVSIIVNISCYAQTNLISNWSFESNYLESNQHKPSDWWLHDDDLEQGAFLLTTDLPPQTVNWSNMNNTAHSPTIENADPFFSYAGVQDPFNGNSYVGIIAQNCSATTHHHKGRIGYQLSSGLDPNKEYVLIFHFSGMDNSSSTPNLKVYINDAFSDPAFGYQALYNKKVTWDGSPANVTWETFKMFFRPSTGGYNWLIFKVNNDFLLSTNWAGVYIDGVELYEKCDYISYQLNFVCSQTYDNAVQPHLISSLPPYYSPIVCDASHPIWFYDLETIKKAHIEIINGLGSTIRNIIVECQNGIKDVIYWDQRTDAGAVVAAAGYTAKLTWWNDCSSGIRTWQFAKISTQFEPLTVNIGTFNDNCQSNGANVPLPCYCAVPDISINNVAIDDRYYGLYGTNAYLYASCNNITFGPNVDVGNDAKVILWAENSITIQGPNHISPTANFTAGVGPCSQHPNARIETTHTNDNDDSIMLELFPNPTEGMIHIKFNNGSLQEKDIFVYDILGNKIYSIIRSPSNYIDINISHNPRGIYLVKVIEGDRVAVKKIILM